MLLLACSCNRNANTTTDSPSFQTKTMDKSFANIPIINNVELKESLFDDIGNCIDSLIYIPLSSKEYLIGNIDKVLYNDKLYYILDKMRDCVLIYDEEGNLKKKILNKGRANNEYLRITDISISGRSKEFRIIDELSSKVIVYDLDGNYKKSIKHDLMFTGMNILSDSIYVFTMGPWQNEGTSLAQTGLAIKMPGNDSINVAFQYLPVQNGHCGGNTLIQGDDRLLFKPTFSDTLYVINHDGTYDYAYYFDIPGSAWEKNKNSEKFINLLEEKNKIYPWIFETRDFLLAYTDFGKELDKNRRMTTILFNRKTGATELFHMQDLSDPATMEKFCGYDWVGTKDQWFISTINPSVFVNNEILEHIKSGKISVPAQLKNALSTMSEESNPILVMVKFK